MRSDIQCVEGHVAGGVNSMINQGGRLVANSEEDSFC